MQTRYQLRHSPSCTPPERSLREKPDQRRRAIA
jgi:hypothetical protein